MKTAQIPAPAGHAIIAVLPPELADQIAAGEVVERPASVVKELVENSVDAGATEVSVQIEAGGRRLIRVRDDGYGMNEASATLCLKRHATSKLRSKEDLFNIGTLGFRGEALPSIASVSRLSLSTRPEGQIEGTRVTVEGGTLRKSRPVACPVGTDIEVADLFFNTPARLKFLKTDNTERRHITEALVRMALARPELYVRLVADNRRILDAPGATDLRERASSVLGVEVAESLYTAPESWRGDVRVTGLFGSPVLAKRNSRGVFTFVNGRFVRDRRVQAAVSMAYSGLLEKGRYPMVVLHIDLPSEDVDVNVHPMKIEVRFDEPDLVFRAVRAALVDGLARTPWVPKPPPARVYQLVDSEPGENFSPMPVQEPLLGPTSDDLSGLSLHAGFTDSLPVQQTLNVREPSRSGPMVGWWTSALDHPIRQIGSTNAPPSGYFSSLHYLSRLGETFLVCQDEFGMVMLDQHAAHERITFERLRAIYQGHHRQIQNLLLPLELTLDGLQAATLEEHKRFFDEVGFEIDQLGDELWVLRCVPAILARSRYQRLIADALDEIAQAGHSQRFDEAVDAVLSRMACHGSVRGGDRMKPEEVRALLEQLDQIDFKANCPHGRPVYFRMLWEEIEKRFERR